MARSFAVSGRELGAAAWRGRGLLTSTKQAAQTDREQGMVAGGRSWSNAKPLCPMGRHRERAGAGEPCRRTMDGRRRLRWCSCW